MSQHTIDALGKKVPQRVIRALSKIPYAITYVLADTDFGADSTRVFTLPSNKRGKIVAVDAYDVTEVFTEVGSPARVDIGDGSDADAYALTGSFGALATDESLNFDEVAGLTEGALGSVVPAGAEVTVTGVAAGTPDTGIATIAITVILFE